MTEARRHSGAPPPVNHEWRGEPVTADEHLALRDAWRTRFSSKRRAWDWVTAANEAFDEAWAVFNEVQERRDAVLDAFDSLILGRPLRAPEPPPAPLPDEEAYYINPAEFWMALHGQALGVATGPVTADGH